MCRCVRALALRASARAVSARADLGGTLTLSVWQIFANGKDGTNGYARIWVTVSCNLRDDDKAALSELGFSVSSRVTASSGSVQR